MTLRSNPDNSRQALFSDDLRHRYTLLIKWDDSLPRMTSVGLNPSTADEFKNDPTVAREVTRATNMGYGSLLKVNLFSLRATNPQHMKNSHDPYGDWRSPKDIIASILEHDAERLVVATWGNHGAHKGRSWEFRKACEFAGIKLKAYRINSTTSEPTHPLYLPLSLMPEPLCA